MMVGEEGETQTTALTREKRLDRRGIRYLSDSISFQDIIALLGVSCTVN